MGTIRVGGGSEHSAAFGDLSDGRTQHRRLLAVPLSTAGRRRSRAGRPAPELRSPPGQQLRRPLAGPPAAPPESRPLPPWASYWTLSPRPGSAPRICFQRGLGPCPPCRLQPEPAPHGWVCSGVGSGLPGHPRLLRPPRCQARPICCFLLSVTYEAVTPPPVFGRRNGGAECSRLPEGSQLQSGGSIGLRPGFLPSLQTPPAERRCHCSCAGGDRPEGWVTGVPPGQGCPPSALHATWGVLGGRFPGWGWGWGAHRCPVGAVREAPVSPFVCMSPRGPTTCHPQVTGVRATPPAHATAAARQPLTWAPSA